VLSLIPLFPLVGFLINASIGKRLSKGVSGGLACLVMLASFAVSAAGVWQLVGMAPGTRDVVENVYTWIASGDFVINLAFRLDPLSAVMILVVTGVGSLIHIYSTSYMHEETDSEFARYFSYLNLFVFFMLLLVLGSNVLVMFVGWEGVGLCSYLLIGYYYKRQSASDAANKAFIVNRIGDYAFILGTLLTVVTVGSLDFREIATRVAAMSPEATFGTLSLITLLLFIGATGKSAQIPLYVWLPDAMEGPTPVSALIHAATMVTAGVYMIGRNAVLFEHAPLTLTIVAIIGTATALMAGTIGLVQNDIKRVLAYSTVSQLGYMFMAMGVGAFGAGIFHLYTHAFFKALLFLGSGAVIHALHGEQDIRNMGGLRTHLPITFWTFMIGSLAIAGVPGLAGFFSKDEILFETFSHGYQWLWGVGIVTSLLTATYMFRLVYLTFYGEERFALGGGQPPSLAHGSHARSGATSGGLNHAAQPQGAHDSGHGGHGGHGVAHLHDAPPAMALALVVLALGSVLAGYIGIPHALGGHNLLGAWLEPAFEAHESAGLSASMIIADCDPLKPDTTTAGGALAGMAIANCEPGADVAQVANVTAAGNSGSSSLATATEPTPVAAGLQSGRPDAALQPEPSAGARGETAADEHAREQLELTLMGVSSVIALLGIGLATWLWLKNPRQPERIAASLPGLHRLLLNKYYVDELYDVTVVQPVKIVSEDGLWRGMDVRVVDGAVNGAGQVVAALSAVLRLLQSGSVKAYAASTFLGVVLILAYYIWR
jgi:NADH-quinone oxidoreductase subunit L